MELVTEALENPLEHPLDFTYKKAANYITDRRSVSFHPSGSNIYHPKQERDLIKLNYMATIGTIHLPFVSGLT